MSKLKGVLPVVNKDGRGENRRLTAISGGGASFRNKLETMKLLAELIEKDGTCFDELKEFEMEKDTKGVGKQIRENDR